MGEEAMLPKDPAMLLSVVNTKLRDQYPSLRELCAAEGVEEAAVSAALDAIGYRYDPAQNQFR